MVNNLKNLVYDKEIYKPGETKILYDKLEDGEKNLYIVSTPLQLLCAIEAQNHFNTQNNILVILFFLIGDGKNIDQMFKISELFPYNKLITYRQSNGMNIKVFKKYLLEVSKYDYNYTFFGYGTPIYRRMIANINYKTLYMLDDGIHSITVHEQLQNQHYDEDSNFLLTQEPKNIRKKLRNMIYFTSGIKVDSTLKDLNFFSMFNLEKYNDCVTHNFAYVKKVFTQDEKIDTKVYILGQPLKKAIGMKRRDYVKYLEKIFEYHKAEKIIYIPHRTEILSDLFEYILYNQKNVSILDPNMPIELFFMKSGIVPHKIYAFMSSALFTINKIFPESKPKYIEIDTSPYSQFHQKNIQLIYDNYKKDGIEKFNDEA